MRLAVLALTAALAAGCGESASSGPTTATAVTISATTIVRTVADTAEASYTLLVLTTLNAMSGFRCPGVEQSYKPDGPNSHFCVRQLPRYTKAACC